MCPKCGGPLTAAGNCANLCGGATAPAPTTAVVVAARVLLLAAHARA